MKKFVFALTILFVLLAFQPIPAFSATDPPEILAESAMLIDAKSGTILFDKNIDALKEPASTTKIITCLLALENLELDRVITIDAETPFTEGSRIYLLEGEQITVGNLLYALMLESANDAAVALAKEMAGTVDAFAVMMNERAKELGAKNTTFINPNGLHLEGHYSTAYDLAMIAKAAMQNETFRMYVSTYRYVIPATNKQPERPMYNTNRLIYDEQTKVIVNGISRPAKYEGAIGIKTGYTSHAGGCLVSGAEKDGTELIAVVLKSSDNGRFGDSIALFDFGFANYYTYKAVDSTTQVDAIKVKKGAVNKIGVAIKEDRYITLPKEASTALISTKTVMDESVKAPVSKGQQVGRVEVYEAGEIIDEVPVVVLSAVDEGGFLSRFGIEDSTSAKINKFLVGFIIFAAIVVVLYIALKVRYERRRKAMRVRRAMEIARNREQKQREMEQRRWPY